MSAPTAAEPGLPALPGLMLIRELGRGGSGVVYAAQRLEDAATVAVKLLRDEYATPDVRRRLRDEARRAGRVSHPGVVKVLDVGEQDDRTWLVMELVDGPSLQEVLDRDGALPPALGAELIGQAADALAAIHAAGLAHGDLKPANVLLPGWPEPGATFDLSTPVKLVDFGLSRPLPPRMDAGLSAGSDWVHSGSTVIERSPGGTVAYMAPEQWRGEPATASSDVYAMGGTLHAALTGSRPFAEPSLPQLAYAVATAPAPTPSRVAPAVSPALDAVVARALAKDPAQRYADAAALAAAIRAATRVPAERPQRRRTARRAVRSAGRLLSPAMLLLAVLFFGSGFLTVSCTPNGYGRAAAGATTTYTGGDLATGGSPEVDKRRPTAEFQPDRLGPQPLLALAALLLVAGAVAAFALPLRRPSRHREIVALAAAAATCLVVGETLARSAVIDRLAGQLTYPLPRDRKVSDFVGVGQAFWASLGLTLLVVLGHAAAELRRRRRVRDTPIGSADSR
jgi:protein kinase-like protein